MLEFETGFELGPCYVGQLALRHAISSSLSAPFSTPQQPTSQRHQSCHFARIRRLLASSFSATSQNLSSHFLFQ